MSTMAYKNKEKKREYERQHYADNKKYYAEKRDKHRKKKVKWLKEFKKSLSCEVCGESRVCCLEFHHTGDNKEINIAHAAHNAWSIERMLKEIEKCMVLCANCHRVVHSVSAALA